MGSKFALPSHSLLAPQGYSALAGSVKQLSLADNRVTGAVPQWLSDFIGLQFLDLGGNALTGSLPDVFPNTLSVKCVASIPLGCGVRAATCLR